ncbi:hypothetical protein F7725_020797 [Dissostichus mawsoni]|uniref:Uncharacterized protein n=1 Tax=Dissostichus mawsoni TaxID=36200 RepID=A0A7J5YG68_DISMA|nr:hypothetical protein F7725_020797 [Dissostichus mawsoni]
MESLYTAGACDASPIASTCDCFHSDTAATARDVTCLAGSLNAIVLGLREETKEIPKKKKKKKEKEEKKTKV